MSVGIGGLSGARLIVTIPVRDLGRARTFYTDVLVDHVLDITDK